VVAVDLWPQRSALQLSFRCAVSAVLAIAAAEAFQLQYPIYAMISAVIVSDLSPTKTRQLGPWRLIGSVLGALVGALMSHFLPFTPWTTGLSILLAMFLSNVFRLQGSAVRLAGYVCGIIVLDHAAEPWSYAVHRLLETVLGIGAAMLVSFIPRLGGREKAATN
jgi:uncharacterized membrane protein YgaE (UPF0421/DUF939 family)